MEILRNCLLKEKKKSFTGKKKKKNAQGYGYYGTKTHAVTFGPNLITISRNTSNIQAFHKPSLSCEFSFLIICPIGLTRIRMLASNVFILSTFSLRHFAEPHFAEPQSYSKAVTCNQEGWRLWSGSVEKVFHFPSCIGRLNSDPGGSQGTVHTAVIQNIRKVCSDTTR